MATTHADTRPVDVDEAELDRMVEQDPHDAGRHNARLVDAGHRVWVIIDFLKAKNWDVAKATQAYGASPAEVRAAIRCFESQFGGANQAGEVYPNGEPLYDAIRHYSAYYGSMIRTRYGEPFFTTETMRVDDVAALEVSTF